MLEEDKIIVGDSSELLADVTDESVPLIHTSPPYNIDRPHKGGNGDGQPLNDYTAFLDKVLAECVRVLRPGGSLFWQTGYTQLPKTAGILPLDVMTFPIFSSRGVLLWDRIIWRYLGGMAFKRKFTNRHETIYW